MNVRPAPDASDTTAPSIQVSTDPWVLSKDTVTSNPSPAGIVAPLNEKANKVVAEALIVKPASADDPPAPPVISTPDKPNWYPPTAVSFTM